MDSSNVLQSARKWPAFFSMISLAIKTKLLHKDKEATNWAANGCRADSASYGDTPSTIKSLRVRGAHKVGLVAV
jgi:hypothetical protein